MDREEADNDPYYWVEQYFDNNYGVDVQDYIESSTELNSRVIEFYISEYVECIDNYPIRGSRF